MKTTSNDLVFDEEHVLHKLKHFLPSQGPLKDFIHHNTLHGFQDKSFFEALEMSNDIFGYKSSLSLQEYRSLFKESKISEDVLQWVINNSSSSISLKDRKPLMFNLIEDTHYKKRIGLLRQEWKDKLHIDINTIVHLNLFKLVGTYLDQGISSHQFPNPTNGFLNGIIAFEKNTFFGFFHSKRVKELLFKENKSLHELLNILVGNESYFEQYLFDQQFAHPGWSGFVAVIEEKPKLLFDIRRMSFSNFVYVELLLEIDALDKIFGEGKWAPIAELTEQKPLNLFQENDQKDIWAVKQLWQECFEFSYYDQVLRGLKEKAGVKVQNKKTPSFQAFFCIDDREESIRRHVEALAPECETMGTPAHFNLPVFYKPAGGKFNTQVCPAPVSPKHLIVDIRASSRKKKDLHFHQSSHSLFRGWIISQTLGFWSAMKLFINIFKPTVSPAHSSSFEHMSSKSELRIENTDNQFEDGLSLGFSIEEMCKLVESELKRTGLTDNFAPLVYLFGHGGSSTNNPYYAGYNCGACSGRPGSLNSRVFAQMANRDDVRAYLALNSIIILPTTQFIGGLHDTTRDEFVFYDRKKLTEANYDLHKSIVPIFNEALAKNAKERARQFISIDISKSTKKIHKQVKDRSVSLFEPRPELNHSNNCLCIVGSRNITKNLFLDQRSFLCSYDWKEDQNGDFLMGTLNAATPVCGGINLEYYFSRVDNENFGSGSKLPHNVVGLFGVANGIEGDLRTGLPIQMVEVHDPLRLLMVVEQKPEIVMAALKRFPNTFDWYKNGWLNLAILHPETDETYIFKGNDFVVYEPINKALEKVNDLESIFEANIDNLPAYNMY
jgi:uncharacterized protein YbcC (UPF0753/DUF2309 family)